MGYSVFLLEISGCPKGGESGDDPTGQKAAQRSVALEEF
jgi:hypothetical protein